MKYQYKDIDEIIMVINSPNKEICLSILQENMDLFKKVQGSSSNHQAWEGGYYDHIREVMNIAIALYESLNSLRALTFSLSDALLVLFLHDIEKPWKYKIENGKTSIISRLKTKESQIKYRDKKLKNYGIVMSDKQRNAFEHVEGEIIDHSSKKRAMNKLGAFCHMCDIVSARLWHDKPDKWATK